MRQKISNKQRFMTYIDYTLHKTTKHKATIALITPSTKSKNISIF